MKLKKKAIDLLRARTCMTVNDLSKTSGVSKCTINAGYERDINPVAAGKLAKALNVDVTEIIIKE